MLGGRDKPLAHRAQELVNSRGGKFQIELLTRSSLSRIGNRHFTDPPGEESMKFVATLALAAAAVTLSAPASAQFAKPEDAVKYRQSALFVMSQHFGRIGAMVNGRAPYDARAAVENADVVAEMSKLPWAGFIESTKGVSQKAKAEIWAEQAKFKEHNERLVGETGKLLAAAKTNNLDNLKTAFGNTAAACKACHDSFRNN
jgi:cytochrome c556